jgi:DNA-binding transcriptional regulator YhcF (GntR family)
MERSYLSLRMMLRSGAYAFGARLDANRLAQEIGISMTPVRDALHRLAGERMVDAGGGDGFHVPRMTEAEVRQLYEWNAALLSMAIRTIPTSLLSHAFVSGDSEPLPERVSSTFERVADEVSNGELRAALHAATLRLHPFRIVEPLVLDDLENEWNRVARIGGAQLAEIRRYHLRRMRAAPEIVSAAERRQSGNAL